MADRSLTGLVIKQKWGCKYQPAYNIPGDWLTILIQMMYEFFYEGRESKSCACPRHLITQ